MIFADQTNGSLAVPGADKDMERLAEMVKKHGNGIDDIQITMDSHYRVHIAHPRVWVNPSGKHPDPFTPISVEDVEQGKWRAFNGSFQSRYLEYVQTLEKNSRYGLMIWPEHCIIGSPGQCIFPVFLDAVAEWEARFFAIAPRTTKGSNPFTEHYSAVKADVEDSADSKTRLNTKLIDTLKEFDVIPTGGEALSHCLANTLRDVFKEFGEDQVKKFVLLTDACSNVPNCEKMGEDFVNEFTVAPYNMRTAKTTDFF